MKSKKKKTAAPSKWKHFERLVAAIHKAATDGADVRWNDKINGRQFDVTIRFRKGLYDYLTVVECKDFATAVPVEKVEAFVTKAADVQANQAVMASPLGFQSGTQEVAAKHHVELFLITESTEVDHSIFGARLGKEIPALNIVEIELEYADGKLKKLPDPPNARTYYSQKLILRNAIETCSLDSVITSLKDQLNRGTVNEYVETVIDCIPGTEVIAPDDGEFPLKVLTKIHVTAGLVQAKTLIGPTLFDPALLVPDIKAKNLATGEETTYSHASLPLGIDTVFCVGEFYAQPGIGFYFYCDKIEGDTATILLVESYQLGILLQAELFVKTKDANWYIPVPTSDEALLKRLRQRLRQIRENQAES